MAAWRRIVVMPNLFSRFEGQLRCELCGRPLYIGDHAWSHMCPRKGASYTIYYCIVCYPKLWI